MRRTLILLILLTASISPTHAGWFSRDKGSEIMEREQRIKAEEQLKAAQQRINTQERQIQGQQQAISRLHRTNTLALTGAVILLIIGVAMGSTARRDENKS